MKPNVTQHGYDAGGQLTRVDVWLQQAAAPSVLLAPATADRHAVTAIAYNARGQRAAIAYGNSVATAYAYDPQAFRLTQLTTTRPGSFAASQQTVQALKYFYDPIGNITRIRDDADSQNVIYFQNQRVEPSSDYTYDPLYRLISASGREHLGQTNGALSAAEQVTDDDSLRIRLLQPGDGNAMGTYVETYAYDALGNILTMAHQVASGGWTRRYAYNETSQIVAAEIGNRLSATSLPGDPAAGPYAATYAYDAHGNMTRMPHLPALVWDESDRLRSTTGQVVNAGTPQTTYYVYDASGERVCKITEGQASAGQTPTRVSERFYLGNAELYREFAADGTTVALARETLHVDAGDHPIAFVETRTIGNDPAPAQLVRYQFANHLGSAVLELDDQSNIVSYEEYFPFGGTSYQAVANQTNLPKRYRYTDKERDEENGLYYHGARYYAPWLGIWISPDPLDSPKSFGTGQQPQREKVKARDQTIAVTTYQYAAGNPIRYVDPDGRAPDPAQAIQNIKDAAEALQRTMMSTHAMLRGTFDAALAESQGGTIFKPSGEAFDHLKSLTEGSTDVQNKLNALREALNVVAKDNPSQSSTIANALRPLTDKANELIRTSQRAKEVIEEINELGYADRLEDVAFEAERSEAGLTSSQLADIERTLLPVEVEAEPAAQELLTSIESMPITPAELETQINQAAQQVRDNFDKLIAAAGATGAVARGFLSRAGSALMRWGGAAIEGLAEIGSRFTTVPIFLVDKEGHLVGTPEYNAGGGA